MSEDRVQIVARLPADLIERVDAYAERLGEELSITVSRNDAIRKLLEEGLAAQHRRKK
jgi:hypothetical protein